MRLATAAMATAFIVLGACEDSNNDGGGGDWYGGHHSCRQYTSCGTCTPVVGCGWCLDSDGTGLCVSDPDECPTPSFTWTWNETGCRVPSDAGVGPAPLGSFDATDAPSTSADDAASSDDGGGGASDASSTPDGAPEGSAPEERTISPDAN
jgi:hypothetical protein